MSAPKEDLFGIENEADHEYDSEEIEEQGKGFSRSKQQRAGSEEEYSEGESEGESNAGSDAEEEVGDEEQSEGEEDQSEDDDGEEKDDRFAMLEEDSDKPKKTSKKKVKPLTAEQLEKFQQDINRTGVVYLSRVPPFMKPAKVKQLLSRYAEIGRVYLAPEDAKITARRKKYAKNNKQNFTEGWVEFKDKKKAKAVAAMLNTQQIG
jgi:ESF2/ABP1 family protein